MPIIDSTARLLQASDVLKKIFANFTDSTVGSMRARFFFGGSLEQVAVDSAMPAGFNKT
jgi:hypothetical protein